MTTVHQLSKLEILLFMFSNNRVHGDITVAQSHIAYSQSSCT